MFAGGTNLPGTGANAMPFNPRAFEEMMSDMFRGGANGNRCGGFGGRHSARWSNRRGKKGQVTSSSRNYNIALRVSLGDTLAMLFSFVREHAMPSKVLPSFWETSGGLRILFVTQSFNRWLLLHLEVIACEPPC